MDIHQLKFWRCFQNFLNLFRNFYVSSREGLHLEVVKNFNFILDNLRVGSYKSWILILYNFKFKKLRTKLNCGPLFAPFPRVQSAQRRRSCRCGSECARVAAAAAHDDGRPVVINQSGRHVGSLPPSPSLACSGTIQADGRHWLVTGQRATTPPPPERRGSTVLPRGHAWRAGRPAGRGFYKKLNF